ncbi:hypothetical protein AAG570_006898 [Ranatra chinensis]|uniref:Ubiquitin carboxyl-terminal hydrolase n=1 Tax=Ranatra chinensis TaxID=642074 RepID=A0ABD0YVE6_9HEMI
MPPVRKLQLDKAAWAWSDNVDPDQITDDNIRTAYRINLPKCKVGMCRRNCRGNPYCLSGLGESKWLGNYQDDSEDDDPDLETREPNSFVGLKNLGATCYVNSLLQLWFHNLSFRRSIFRWNPMEDPVESTMIETEDGTVNSPRTVVGHLQLLFGLMQFSKRKFVDPSEFIKVLDLEPSTQQDAQEFSKLFISLLEDSLSQQSDLTVRNLINNNFKGEYSYMTRCSKCQKESVSPSQFYELELNVKGNKTLHESLTEFLREEKLEGANMYSCSTCQDKQEAARFIRLQSLPPVLNLQLMRFIYDRQKGHKKKLNSSFQFPDSLDMSIYLNNECGEKLPLIYHLTAVLIHKGPSAYSGHYIAHICDQTTGTWYKFNDECVEKMEGKKLKLGSEEDTEDGSKKVKQPRLAKGFLASSNAYMLVYTAASVEEGQSPITEADITPYVLKQVQLCNEGFDNAVENTREERKNRKANGKVHRAEMASLLNSLPVGESVDSKWEAISRKWLSYWLSNSKSVVQAVDNSKLLCIHGKLDPNSLGDAKYINTTAGETIYEKYGGGPQLIGKDVMCKECVIAKCKGIRTRTKISEDAKEILNLLKQKENLEGPGFWVGKRSLKAWRRMAIKLLMGKEELTKSKLYKVREEYLNTKQSVNSHKFVSGENDEHASEPVAENVVNGNDFNSVNNCSSRNRKRKFEVDEEEKDGDSCEEGKLNGTGYARSDDDEDEDEDFNEDIVCTHGNMVHEDAARRFVTENVWAILKSYFPNAREFPRETEPCHHCQCLASEGQVAKDLYRQQAQTQKELLQGLLLGKNRPKSKSGTYHIVSVTGFLEPWRKFIR